MPATAPAPGVDYQWVLTVEDGRGTKFTTSGVRRVSNPTVTRQDLFEYLIDEIVSRYRILGPTVVFFSFGPNRLGGTP